MSTIAFARITYFAIFLAVFFGFEFYIQWRRKKPDVLFLVVESNFFKGFVLFLALSVFVMDYFNGVASKFVYVAIFFSYAFSFKEITLHGVVTNLKFIKAPYINKLELVHKEKVYYVRVHTSGKVNEMIVRESISAGLEDAVNKLSTHIKKNQ